MPLPEIDKLRKFHQFKNICRYQKLIEVMEISLIFAKNMPLSEIVKLQKFCQLKKMPLSEIDKRKCHLLKNMQVSEIDKLWKFQQFRKNCAANRNR